MALNAPGVAADNGLGRVRFAAAHACLRRGAQVPEEIA